MVKLKYHRYQRWRKGDVYGLVEDEESHSCLGFLYGNYSGFYKKATLNKLFYFAFLSFTFIYFISSSSTFSFLYSFGVEDGRSFPETNVNVSLCSFIPNGTLCCDRSSTRSDICIMKGDVRTEPATSSVFLYRAADSSDDYVLGDDDSAVIQHEKIKPYTRKWEQIMDTVTQLNLFVKKANLGTGHGCDVQHNVPAVFFSTSGYTGNLYHEFNDGILPLYITSQHLNKKVVFVNLDYHNWWIMKYGDIVSQLTDYPVINFSGDNRTHCFPEAIVGLRIHDELSIDPSLMKGNKTVRDFRNLLDQAYWPRIRGLIQDEEREAQLKREKLGAPSPSSLIAAELSEEKTRPDLNKKPKLVIISRSGGSREVTNEVSMVKVAEEIGFSVEVVKPVRTSELAVIYRALNSSDVMIGVHGAALTHFLYMRPGCVFIQIIPLGTDWAAETYFGEASVRFGLKYIRYKILPKESSLYDEYEEDDPVLTDPDSINLKGWEITKQVYLDHQNVRLNLARFQKPLFRAYYYTIAKKKGYPPRFHQYQSQ